jgi:hypothetical protein
MNEKILSAGIDVLIDKLTPCLEELATGKIFQTTFSIANADEITGLQEKGWNFDWADKGLNCTNIYKLQIKDDSTLQGLVSAEVVRGAVYIHLAESAPHNLGKTKKFSGVGGHLIAIAIKLSVANCFDGYVFFNAKNIELVTHYQDMFGARLLRTRIHEYRMEISETKAMELLKTYTLEEHGQSMTLSLAISLQHLFIWN